MNSGSRSTHTPSVWQLILGVISLSIALITAIALGVVNLANQVSGQSAGIDLQPFNYLAWITFAIGCTGIPSIIYAAKRLGKGKPLTGQNPRLLLLASVAFILLVPLAWLTTLPFMSAPPAFFKALFNILFVGIPAWWIVELGRRGLPRVTRQKQWGLINFGVFVTMPVVILVEIILLGAGAALLIGWLRQQPEFAPLLDQVTNLLVLNPQRIDLLTYQLEPLLKSPVVMGAVLLSFSLFIPMVEELLKPLALWIFIKRRWSPAEGFVAGMLSGAAFAFVESIISLAAVSSAGWLTLAGGRAAAALLHITTAGFMGWALTSSWIDGKYVRIALTYVGVVLVHGAWNFLAVMVGLSAILDPFAFPALQSQSEVAPWIMVALALGLLALLIIINTKLKKSNPLPGLPPQLPLALPPETGLD